MAHKLTPKGIHALKSGDRTEARQFLTAALKENPSDETAWLWLSGAVDSDDQKIDCLERVLAIDPQNQAAREGLQSLEAKRTRRVSAQLLERLTDPQKEAVLQRGGPLLIIAGPGSGKTEVIARRVASMVSVSGIGPEKILAVTFTEKAAQGLKDRIQQKLPEINVETMQISTIHAFCARLLRDYGAKSARPKGFRILDENGQLLLVFSNRKALGLAEIVKGRPQDFFKAVLHTINLATEEMVEPERLLEWCQENEAGCAEKESALWEERKAVAEAYRKYCALLEERNLVDFGFLQRFVLELIEAHPEILEELREQYQEMLVDEYQDTNAIQERLFKTLAGDGHHLTVVGDDDQSIYRFRGATVQNIRDFPQRYPGTRVIDLVHNFRSRIQIVDHSLKVIEHNPARFPKELQAVRGLGSEVLLVYERTAAEEAAAMARIIQRLHHSGRIESYGEAVILLRSVRSYANAYIEALGELGMPCQVLGDGSLFEKDEIAPIYDLFNFLSASKEWGDKYVRDPVMGLSESACEALKSCKQNLLSFEEEAELEAIGIEETRDRLRLKRLLDLKRKVQAQEHASALEVFYALLEISGCVGRLERTGEAVALSNLGALSRLIAAWDEYGSTRNFYPFREYLKLLREEGVDPAEAPAGEAVRIMTIHKVKGLEFPVVILGAAMDGRLPSTRRKDPYEIPYTLRASKAPEVEDPHLVDERKLFYVAATRARDLLVVGTADVVNKRGGGPSPFVYEMFGPDLSAAARFSEERLREIERQPHGNPEPRPRHSYSQLAYYAQCPMRYKFGAVYGFAVPWLDPVDFGANVHRCLEAIHRRALQGDYAGADELPELVDQNWLSSSQSKPEQEVKYRRAAVAQLQRYIEAYGERLPEALQAETRFSAAIGNHVLIGKIDLVRKAGDKGVEIVDFKTSGSGVEEIDQAARQLDLYALGIEGSLKDPIVRQTAHFLGDEKAVEWDWEGEKREAARRELAELFSRIERGEFPPRTSYCGQCQEFRAICPYAVDRPAKKRQPGEA